MSTLFKTRFLPFTLAGHTLAVARAGHPVFAGINFQVSSGEVLLVTGSNGSGKSSLLRVLAGLLPSSEGRVTCDSAPVDLQSDTYQETVCYLGHTDGLKPLLTPRENLLFYNTLRCHRPSSASVTEAAAYFGLDTYLDTPTRLLSAGQKRRVALAARIISPARLWLLDEPTTALDQAGIHTLENALKAHCVVGGSAILSTHGTQFSFPKVLSLDVNGPETQRLHAYPTGVVA